MLNIIRNYFLWPTIISVVIVALIGYYLGLPSLFIVLTLVVLEVTLSFDNAIVNARVLERMTPKWRHRFLTWGILLAVFGTRFVLPILIISIATWASPAVITKLAISDPAGYGELLHGVHGQITAFGALFLLMVALRYFFDQSKQLYWFKPAERVMAKWGNVESISIGISLVLLLIFSFISHDASRESILTAGLVGIILFLVVEAFARSLDKKPETLAVGGASLFIYLETLDTAFSLDGVIGAFALTSNLVIIAAGLGIGALFVREFTLYLVKQKTLTELVYLEHGAHWAILGLSLAMLANLVTEVPEFVIGLIGLCFIVLAYISSKKENGRREKAAETEKEGAE